jgi:hypothetical protein
MRIITRSDSLKSHPPHFERSKGYSQWLGRVDSFDVAEAGEAHVGTSCRDGDTHHENTNDRRHFT